MNRRKWTIALGVLLFLGSVMVSACGGPTVYVDRGLAEGVPCEPPCWEGLVAGVSTEEEVRQTLERLEESGQIPPIQDGLHSYLCEGEDWQGELELWIKDGTLALAWGSAGFDMDVQQLIDRMGPPQEVIAAQLAATVTCSCDAPHARVTPGEWYGFRSNAISSLFYPEKGMRFSFDVPPKTWAASALI